MSELSKKKCGISVYCEVCGNQKKPFGRDAPITSSYCMYDCTGYHKEPLPGSLWPGESEFDFGFAVGEQGVETEQKEKT